MRINSWSNTDSSSAIYLWMIHIINCDQVSSLTSFQFDKSFEVDSIQASVKQRHKQAAKTYPHSSIQSEITSNSRSAEQAHSASNNAMTSDIITQKMSHSFGPQFSIASVSKRRWIKSTLCRSVGVSNFGGNILLLLLIYNNFSFFLPSTSDWSVHPGQLGAILNIECSVYTVTRSPI